MSQSRPLFQGLAIVAAVGCATACDAAGPLRPIALTGTSGPLGPGLGPDVTFSSLKLTKTAHPEFGTDIPAGPSISGTGAVAFGGLLAGPNISTANGSGIFAVRSGAGISLIARRGDQIPGLDAGYTFGELFTAPQICDTGAVNFQSMIEGNDSSPSMDEGMFTERSGVLSALIREGVTQVPEASIVFGLASSNIGGDPWGNNGWTLNRHGDTALRCFVRDENPDYNSFSGIYTNLGGPLAKHYRSGDTANEGSQIVHFMGSTNPRMNDSGAFLTARLTDARFSLHLWSNRATNASGFGIPGVGTLQPIFLSDQTPAPGTPYLFHSVSSPRDFHLNAAGRIAFAADMDGGDMGAPAGFWSDGRFGVLQLIALARGPAAGTPSGVTFNLGSQFIVGSAFSDNNVVVFKAQLFQDNNVGSGNDTGLWSTRSTATGQPGNLRLVVREGDQVPASAGPDYAGLSFGEVESFWVNASGHLAFIVMLNDFTHAIFVEQADGSLVPVVKEFAPFDVYGDGSDVRFVSEIDPVPGALSTSSGVATAFNDHDDLAMRLVFVDGSEGIFTTASSVNCHPPAATVSPATVHGHFGEAAQLTVSYSGDAPVHLQWRHNGEPIPDATDPTFNVLFFGADRAGTYDCVLTNFCGTTVSSSAVATFDVACTADLGVQGGTPGQDGLLDNNDFIAFINYFFAANAHADLGVQGGVAGHDGQFDNNDFIAFINAFFAGCP